MTLAEGCVSSTGDSRRTWRVAYLNGEEIKTRTVHFQQLGLLLQPVVAVDLV